MNVKAIVAGIIFGIAGYFTLQSHPINVGVQIIAFLLFASAIISML